MKILNQAKDLKKEMNKKFEVNQMEVYNKTQKDSSDSDFDINRMSGPTSILKRATPLNFPEHVLSDYYSSTPSLASELN